MDLSSEDVQRVAAGYLTFCAACLAVGVLLTLFRLYSGWKGSCPTCGRWWAAERGRSKVEREARRRGTRTRWNAFTTLGVDSFGKPTNVTNFIATSEPVDELVVYSRVQWKCRFCCGEWTTREVRTYSVYEEEIK
jgi:hypothetical protein